MLEISKFSKIKEEDKKEALEELAMSKIAPNFGAWEDSLKANSSQEYWQGDKLTTADFGFVIFYADHVKAGPLGEFFTAQLELYPTVKEYFEARFNGFSDYFEKRPK
mmetsp:Transcript_6096/g.5244  ORF Transcript_6096/g.5244 Transcript_6096/m.5244 type:complete len:107 (-) Transcript_6096:101-421(-)